MKPFLLFALLALVALPAHAQRVLGESPTESGGPLLPEQATYDVTFYDLALRIDPDARAIEGTLTTHAAIVQPVEWFVQHLDALLTVQAVDLIAPDESTRPLVFEQRTVTDGRQTRLAGC